MRRRLAILAFGALLAASSPAFADSNPEALKAFDEGRKLRDQRDFEKAASAFERSAAAEASIGAYYNLAFCYEQLGRTRDALDAYRRSLKLAVDKGDPREKEANEAIAKLLASHNYVTVRFRQETDNIAGLRVVVDGEIVPEKQLRGEVFRSGTRHDVVVSAPGRQDKRFEGINNREEIRIFAGEPYASASATPPPPPAPEPPRGGWGWQKWTGAGMVGGGVVSLAVASILYFPKMAEQLSLNSKVDTTCPNDRCPKNDAGRALIADNNANVQDLKDRTPAIVVTGVLGALLVGGGIYLFATAPSTEAAPPPPNSVRVRVLPEVGLRNTTLSVVGTF